MVGGNYNFTPAASDADNDQLTFSIANKPAWADFDTTDGRVSGTPADTDEGMHSGIEISVSDGNATATLAPFTIEVTAPPPSNSAPTISGTPASTVFAGNNYSFRPTATDADNDPLTFSVTNKPDWASFNSTNGRLHGTPASSDTGVYGGIEISVSDGSETASLGPFSIEVTSPPPGNSAPQISGTPASSVEAGVYYNFIPTATDADNDPLSFSIVNKPAWAWFNNSTGQLHGTPDAGSEGVYGGIEIIVSDGSAAASLGPFSIEVTAPPNSAPTISGTPAATADVGVYYSFIPTAADADNDPLTFSVVNKPAWAWFNTSTGRLHGTPDTGDEGTYSGIEISVSDGSATASLGPFSIEVMAPPNSAPTISGTPAATADVGVYYSFIPTATDADNDPLTFSVVNKPAWAWFNTTTGRLHGTPDAADEGMYSGIVISVSDGTESASLAAFDIEVVDNGGSGDDVWGENCTEISGPTSDNFAGGVTITYQTPANNQEQYVWAGVIGGASESGLSLRKVGAQTEVRLFRYSLLHGSVEATALVDLQDGQDYTFGFRMGTNHGLDLFFNGVAVATNTTAAAKSGAVAALQWFEGSAAGGLNPLAMPLLRLQFFDET